MYNQVFHLKDVPFEDKWLQILIPFLKSNNCSGSKVNPNWPQDWSVVLMQLWRFGWLLYLREVDIFLQLQGGLTVLSIMLR